MATRKNKLPLIYTEADLSMATINAEDRGFKRGQENPPQRPFPDAKELAEDANTASVLAGALTQLNATKDSLELRLNQVRADIRFVQQNPKLYAESIRIQSNRNW